MTVIIPGSFITSPRFLSPFAKLYCWYFGISTSSDHSLDNLQQYLEENSKYDVKQFTWNGKVSKDLTQIGEELVTFLNQQTLYGNIILIGKSLGGNIAEIASLQANFPKNVSKIIFLATPHQKKAVVKNTGVRKYNIYSPEDNYVSFAKKVLYRNFSSNFVANAENIIIPNIRHSEFNINKNVALGRRKIKLFDLYMELLTKY